MKAEYYCRAAGAAIILMVALTRKEKVWRRAQVGKEKGRFTRLLRSFEHRAAIEVPVLNPSNARSCNDME
jgi:hypothetical protein